MIFTREVHGRLGLLLPAGQARWPAQPRRAGTYRVVSTSRYQPAGHARHGFKSDGGGMAKGWHHHAFANGKKIGEGASKRRRRSNTRSTRDRTSGRIWLADRLQLQAAVQVHASSTRDGGVEVMRCPGAKVTGDPMNRIRTSRQLRLSFDAEHVACSSAIGTANGVLPKTAAPFGRKNRPTWKGINTGFPRPLGAPKDAPQRAACSDRRHRIRPRGYFWGRSATPALDKLAANGLRYNRFHTNSAVLALTGGAADRPQSSIQSVPA